jgi:hypothetical protein
VSMLYRFSRIEKQDSDFSTPRLTTPSNLHLFEVIL